MASISNTELRSLKIADRNCASSARNVVLIISKTGLGSNLTTVSSDIFIAGLLSEAIITIINGFEPLNSDLAAANSEAAGRWLIPSNIDGGVISVKSGLHISRLLRCSARELCDSVGPGRVTTTISCLDSEVVLHSIAETNESALSVVELVSSSSITTDNRVALEAARN